MILSIFYQHIFAQKINKDFNTDNWNIIQGNIVEHLGRNSFQGIATLKNVEFENGIIEVDIASIKGRKSYPGVLFRMKNMNEYERVYIRPHRSIFYDDAIQYLASFNGVDSWQLYNGTGNTSSAEIPSDTWNHLKIEVSGSQAKVYLNDMERYILHITNLQHGFSKGELGLFGSTDGSTFFSNFSFIKANELNSAEINNPEQIIGIIDEWEISSPMSVINCDFEKYPHATYLDSVKWQSIKSDTKGLVDISKYYPRKNRLGDCVYARTIINSEKDTTILLNFGYSDYISIFLNSKPAFFGNSVYQSRDKSFLGIAGYFDNVFFPLKKGKNELLILLAETSGGWGFMFRDANRIFLAESLKTNWEINRELQIPETIVFDKNNNVCYVSSYFNEGNEYISKISLDGKIVQKEWITDLNMPTGMCISDEMLYVLERKSLSVFDIASGVRKDRISLNEIVFPNDIQTDGSGTFYISDSRSNAIFKYSKLGLEKWLSSDEITNINGLHFHDNFLFCGIGKDATLKKINLATKEISTVCNFNSGSIIDGITNFDKNNFLVSDFNGILYKVSMNGEKQVLINSKTPQQSIANFEYISEKNQIIIPTLLNNKIISYTFKY